MDNFIFTIVTAMGVVMSIGYYPQAWKIYKSKSAEDVSKTTFLIMGLGTLTWLLYGVYIVDWVIISGFALGVVGSWAVLILSVIYSRKDEDEII